MTDPKLLNSKWNKYIPNLEFSLDSLDAPFNPENHINYFRGMLNEYIHEDFNDVPERNKKWMKKLPTMIEKMKGQILIMVGADHLGTSQGLLAQFARQAYAIRAMNAQGQFKPCVYSFPSFLPIYHAFHKFTGFIKAWFNQQLDKAKNKIEDWKIQHGWANLDQIETDKINKSGIFYKNQNKRINKIIAQLLNDEHFDSPASKKLIERLNDTNTRLITVAYEEGEAKWPSIRGEIDELIQQSQDNLSKSYKISQ